MNFTLRKASLDDRTAIEQLIVDSTRALSREDYSDEQIEAAIGAVFGVDTDLILEGFVGGGFTLMLGWRADISNKPAPYGCNNEAIGLDMIQSDRQL